MCVDARQIGGAWLRGHLQFPVDAEGRKSIQTLNTQLRFERERDMHCFHHPRRVPHMYAVEQCFTSLVGDEQAHVHDTGSRLTDQRASVRGNCC